MNKPPIRIMLADDSSIIRALLARALQNEKDFHIVCQAVDGIAAIEQAQRHALDVIILDVEMPRCDGISAIPELLAACPGVRIIMASTLTKRNAEISLRALQAGAADYMAKPEASMLGGIAIFNRDLVEKVRALGLAAQRQRGAKPAATTIAKASLASQPRSGLKGRPRAIAIGSSTGGPQALLQVLPHLRDLGLPIFLTQHMPPTFTAMLAQNLTRTCGIEAIEASHDMPVVSNRIYVARGDFHMIVTTNPAGSHRIMLNRDQPENFCRPAVDPMLRSMISCYEGQVLALILTGMGQDGLSGCVSLNSAGGTVIAQDEASSVVWGMPGAVAKAGICRDILPIEQIGPWVRAACLPTPVAALP